MDIITLDHLSLEFPIYQGNSRQLKHTLLKMGTGGFISNKQGSNICVVQALNDLSFSLEKGDRLGLIGHNGAGKTTLLRVLAGIYEPTNGSLHVKGKVTPVFDIGLGIDHDSTGYENIIIRGMFLGLTKEAIMQKQEEIGEFTELGDYLHMPLRTFSSGMVLRLCFAVSTCITPEILLMDEWILAGDASFLKKASKRTEQLVSKTNILVLATHSNDIIKKWCNKVLWLEKGTMKAFGPTQEVMPLYEGVGSRTLNQYL